MKHAIKKHINCIAFLLVILSTNLCFGQKYKIGCVGSSEFTFKADGFLTVNDSLLTISIVAKGQQKPTTIKYSLVKRVNFTIYVTDGVKTFEITHTQMSGKLKGFMYDNTFLIPQYGNMVYFCKMED